MAYALRAYSGPLMLALLLHAAALAALHGGWLPRQERSVQAFKPQIVNSTLIVMQPKAKPKPKPPPRKPAAAAPAKAPAKAQAKPKPQPKPPAQPDAEAEQRQRQEQERQRRLAELAQASFAEALASEASELEQEEDEARAQSYRFGIYQRVVAEWSRPPSARNGMEARLLVELIPTGEVVGVTVVESSGSGAFDRSAEAAVRKARTFEVPRQADLFERHFRRFSLLFRPEDLLR